MLRVAVSAAGAWEAPPPGHALQVARMLREGGPRGERDSVFLTRDDRGGVSLGKTTVIRMPSAAVAIAADGTCAHRGKGMGRQRAREKGRGRKGE